MKLLIVTQKVNKDDSILGFFHRWLLEFSKNCESVVVICLEKGGFDLPQNVKVLSLGKEEGGSKLSYLYRFFKYIYSERKNYDAVFVHMNPEYVVLGGIFWRFMRKKIGLWYTHKQVDLKLRLSAFLAHIIFTASKESFRLKSSKLVVMGHGIDLPSFVCSSDEHRVLGPNAILHVGRITNIKNCHKIIEVAKILKEKWNKDFEIAFVGEGVTKDDVVYTHDLKKLVNQYGLTDIVEFYGKVANTETKKYYCSALMSINLSATGGLDKVILESIASGTPVITSNYTAQEYIGTYGEFFDVAGLDEDAIAQKIILYSQLEKAEREQMMGVLKGVVEKKSSLSNLVPSIISKLL
jgi:glycosyltransferase involved in cell wall biosynthesis